MTLETVLYNAKTDNTGGRENGAPRTGDCRLDIKFSPATKSSILIFAASWKKWYCVLRYRKGFGLFDSMRFGHWLARSEA